MHQQYFGYSPAIGANDTFQSAEGEAGIAVNHTQVGQSKNKINHRLYWFVFAFVSAISPYYTSTVRVGSWRSRISGITDWFQPLSLAWYML